jgi:hypothetical protein
LSRSLSAANQDALTPAVLLWASLGTVPQLGLVIAGHYNDAVYSTWPVAGLVVGVIVAAGYTIQTRRSFVDAAWHGAMVAAISTFLGTALAAVLADVPALDLATVTLSGIAAGALTGVVTFEAVRRVTRARSV